MFLEFRLNKGCNVYINMCAMGMCDGIECTMQICKGTFYNCFWLNYLKTSDFDFVEAYI